MGFTLPTFRSFHFTGQLWHYASEIQVRSLLSSFGPLPYGYYGLC
jgi:hypothetical protein